MVAGVPYRTRLSGGVGGSSLPLHGNACGKCRAQFGERIFIGKVQAAGVHPCAIKRFRLGDLVMLGAGDRHRPYHGDRVFQQRIDGHIRIGNAVDEGRVGAIFQQPTNEVGQERFVRPDRRIETARTIKILLADDFAVKRFAHAMQALKLIVADFEVWASEMIDRRHRLRIMGGKLREDDVPRGQQLSGAGDIGHIGVNLAGEDWKVFQTV